MCICHVKRWCRLVKKIMLAKQPTQTPLSGDRDKELSSPIHFRFLIMIVQVCRNWCRGVRMWTENLHESCIKKSSPKKTSCVLLWSLARILLRVFSLIWHKHIALKPSQSGNNTACLTALLFFKNVQCASGLTVRYTSAARAPPLTKMQAREDHRQ